MRRKSKMALTALIATLALLGLAAAPAQAKVVHRQLEEFGSGAPEKPFLGFVKGLAVDQASGDLLVIDQKAGVVRRFKANGEPDPFPALGTNVLDAKKGPEGKACAEEALSCDATPQNGFTFGTFALEQEVAVDSSGGVADGDVYVTQGQSGTGNVVDVFSGAGKYLGQLSEGGGFKFGSGEGHFSPSGLAADTGGNLFVAGLGDKKIYKYTPTANPPTDGDWVKTFSSVAFPYTLAAGAGPSAGALFVGADSGSALKLDAASGKLEYVVDPVLAASSAYVAVDPGSGPSAGHVYVSRSNAGALPVKEYDASGPSPVLVTEFGEDADSIAVDGASGKIYLGKSDGLGGAKVQVYTPLVPLPTPVTLPPSITGDESATLNGTVDPEGEPLTGCFFEYGPTAAYGTTVPCVEKPEAIVGDAPVPVHADLSGLEAESSYHFRLFAKNANGTEEGKDETLRTPSKPAIHEQWNQSATTTTATLKATINPENAETTYFVEWGTTTAYGQETAAAKVAIGNDDDDHEVSVTLSGLAPGATYHWRVVAENSRGTVQGEDRSFTAFRVGASTLPDGRVYELVSPQQKNSGEVGIPGKVGPSGAGGNANNAQPQQASPTGEAITYHSATAFGEDPESAPGSSQYFSRRGPSGWSTENINPVFEEGNTKSPIVGFSSDLSHAAAIVFAPGLVGAPDGFPNIYQRDNLAGVLTAITTQPPELLVQASDYCLSYAGASADSSRVFFAAKGALLAGDPAAKGFNLYEWSVTEGLRLVSVLPDGIPAAPSSETGFGDSASIRTCDTPTALLRHVVSADGSLAFWSYDGTYAGAKDPLFARFAGVATIRLDEPNVGVAGNGGEGRYRDASVDGSKVFFTSEEELTADSTAQHKKPDLYRYDFEAPGGERLTDLSANPGEPADVQGVIGTSGDGSYAYIVANGNLTGEVENAHHDKAQAGKPNLYVWHEGEGLRFIATLRDADRPTPGSFSSWAPQPNYQTARVTPDGRQLAFLSTASISGYDNTGLCAEFKEVPIPAPCAQAFLFDYDSDSLLCVSCNPANSRPLGPTALTSWSAPYEQPRYLSDDGDRLFFESVDALALADTNKKRDVYEWEEAGSGSCTEANATFSKVNGGCMYLLSSGTSGDESFFLDASSDGSDAFLSTRESLLFTDKDRRFDVYDARVGGILPTEPKPPCEGEGCREGSTSVPAPSPAGTPGFQGAGNPTPQRGCPKGRRQVKSKGRTRCVKPKKRQRQKHKANAKRRVGR